MLLKVNLESARQIKNLVSAVSPLTCRVDLQSGTFAIDAKSVLGVLSMPLKSTGFLNVHTDDDAICHALLEKLDLLGVEYERNSEVQKTMFSVCALGEVLIDFTYQGRNEQGQRVFAQNPGGAPANVLALMAKLGSRTAFIGKAGNDMHGRFLKETLDKCGIDTAGFTLTDDYFTTLAFVDIHPDGDREFSFARKHGADKMLEKGDVPSELINSSAILHFGSVSLTEEPSRGTVKYAVEKAKKAGCVISYDPNYRASLWHDEQTAIDQMRSMVDYADLVKISDEETELLTGAADYETAADILLDRGVKIAVVTLGGDGAYVKTAEGGRKLDGYHVNAVDATGAGDSFWGAFLYQYSRSAKAPSEVSLDEAADFARFGNAAASLCVQRFGAIPAMPTMAEIEQRLNENQ